MFSFLSKPKAIEAAVEKGGEVVSESEVFDPAAFEFEARTYRIHFKNGCSGEYDGLTLAQSFPFDPAQVESVEPVETAA